MKNGLYLIHIDDYIRHVEREATMYRITGLLLDGLRRRLDPRRDRQLIQAINETAEAATTVFREIGIPENFAEDSDPSKIARLIADELSAPEDAGYIDTADLRIFGQGGWPDAADDDDYGAEESEDPGSADAEDDDDWIEYVLRRVIEAAIDAVLDKLLEGVEE